MGNRYLFSDPHHGHDAIYRFTDNAGAPLRPWAANAEEGDALMLEAWNGQIKPKDTVYVLGDVAIKRRALALLSRLNGRKILIRGNHDIFKLGDYIAHFEDIRGSHKIDQIILSHYLIHPASIPRWCHGNVHGHIHAQVVRHEQSGAEDLRYFNICVERLGLAPVPFEQVQALMAERYARRQRLSSLREVNAKIFTRYLDVIALVDDDPLKEHPRLSLDNLAWMCRTALETPMPDDKASRWLGFIQGCLAMRGLIDVDEERDLTRPLFHGCVAQAPPSLARS